MVLGLFFFQAEDGIRDLVRSRGLGDVYKRQDLVLEIPAHFERDLVREDEATVKIRTDAVNGVKACLLYTSDAADERSSVDLGGRRIIKKKNKVKTGGSIIYKEKKEEGV